MPQCPTYILVDGTSYIYRAFYAMPALTAPDGKPTGVIYGVVNMLRRLVRQYPADRVTVVFDPAGPTARHDIFPEYKANRVASPADLIAQIEPTMALIRAFGWPVVVVDGVEADDVIGTLALQALAQDFQVVISTADKDFAQLVQPGITLVNTMHNKVYDEAAVIEKFGVSPSQIIDYLALVGDASDNIPGVEKVGPKTAVKWLNTWGSLAGVMAHADSIGGKVGERLRASLAQLPLYQQLVTIDTNVAVSFAALSEQQGQPDTVLLGQQLAQLGFKTWLQQLKVPEPTMSQPMVKQDFVLINTPKAWQQWLVILEKAPYFVLDCETTSLDPHNAALVGLAMAVPTHPAVYIPLQHTEQDAQQLPIKEVLAGLNSLLQEPSTIVIGHHFKYDWHVLNQYKVNINAHVKDTLLMSYLLYGSQKRHTLETLANDLLQYSMIDFKTVTAQVSDFSNVPIEQACQYAAEDAWVTLAVFEKLKQKLNEKPDLLSILQTIDEPLLKILVRMEQSGVLLDVQQLAQQSHALSEEISELTTKAHTLAGEEFNLASPKQLREILFEKLGIPVIKTTSKGEPSTAEEVLNTLASTHALPKLIMAHRQASKLKNTYCDRLPEQVDDNQRVHCSYNQTVTATGRLSSNQPNLQNIPIRTEAGRQIRRAFIAPVGYQIMSADYNQIELRMMAHFSQDAALCAAFRAGHDVHAATASKLFSCPVDQVSSEQRRQAKVVNFGLIYGMSAFGLASQLKIARVDAARLIDEYFQQFPGVKHYMDQVRFTAKQQGFVSTLLKRPIFLPNAKGARQAGAVARAAINGPMQGSAADLIKCAMVKLQTALDETKLDARMIMQVHDELILEVHDSCQKEVQDLVRKSMVEALPLSVPLEVAIGVGQHWGEAH